MSTEKVWLITGASTGFGRTMTEYVLNKGGKVVATLRTPASLEDLKSRFPSSHLLVVKLDVTKHDEVVDAFEQSKVHFGRIDVVFNNAGQGHVGEVEVTPQDQARALFEANFWGANNVSIEAIKFFREVNGPKIGGTLLVNSSMASFTIAAGAGYYGATKSALGSVTEALAKELDPEWNIKVALIEPGLFVTAIKDKASRTPKHEMYSKPTSASNFIRQFYETDYYPGANVLDGVKIIHKLSEAETIPMHFPLGRDAISALKARNTTSSAELSVYEPWSDELPERVLGEL